MVESWEVYSGGQEIKGSNFRLDGNQRKYIQVGLEEMKVY